MKDIAIGLLMVLFLSVLVEPLVELANVMREKIILGSVLSNACTAAKDRSLEYKGQRDLDANVDFVLFKDYFSEAFEDALNVTRTSSVGDAMTFTSNDGKYNTFTVTLEITSKIDISTGKTVTEGRVRAESPYKFKTKYLKLAEGVSSVDYNLASERMFLLMVRN